MSRDAGFAVMDVSVDIVNDPKIRRLFRDHPAQAGAGFLAYLATMGESWKAGHRVSIDDSWPAVLPFDQATVDALTHVKLVDAKGFVSMRAWKSWFEPAKSRRDAVRDRWRRANEKRAHPNTNDSGGDVADSASSPRGSRAATAANHSVPFRTDSVPIETRDSPPPPAERGRRSSGSNLRANGRAPRDQGTNPRANGASKRQVREGQKRAPTRLGDVLRRATATVGAGQPEEADVL